MDPGHHAAMTSRTVILRAAAAYPVAVATLLLAAAIVAPRHGPFALATVLGAHLAIGALVLLPLACLRGARWLRAGLLVLLVVCVPWFGGEWLSLPGNGPLTPRLAVLSWNLERGARAPGDTVAALHAQGAQVVAVQELTIDHARAIEADTELVRRYPYRILRPGDDFLGIGLLSNFPISASEPFDDPAGIEARIESDLGSVTVITAHPLPGRLIKRFGLPIVTSFDPSTRDADLARLRDRVATAIRRGERVVVVGDFNTSPTEAAFRDLVHGLRDVHAEIGAGPGWTWRPGSLEGLGIGLLRIDLALVGPGVRPTDIGEACGLPGDHCQLRVGVAFD
jgi:endonuclease/exonuclease/phosphatase (EEP) superfamily protein YafD